MSKIEEFEQKMIADGMTDDEFEEYKKMLKRVRDNEYILDRLTEQAQTARRILLIQMMISVLLVGACIYIGQSDFKRVAGYFKDRG